MNYASPRDVVNAIADRLRSNHRSFEGAQIRAAFMRDTPGIRFLTGCFIFRESHVPSRPEADYGSIIFVEKWIREQNEALAFLARLLSGQERIENYAVSNTFTHSSLYHDFDSRTTGWPTWNYTSTADRRHDQQAINLKQGPLLRRGLTPYLGPSAAVTDWILDQRTTDYFSSRVPNEENLVTLIPDTRARVVGAMWSPGSIQCEFEVNIPTASVELQMVEIGAKTKATQMTLPTGRVELPVSEDTREIVLYLVPDEGDAIATVHLRSLYEIFGTLSGKVTAADYSATLLAGENDGTEFKPFMKPKEKIEARLLKAVIAFANTAGGRIFVGVDDEGVPQGVAEASKCFKNEPDPVKTQTDRLKYLVRESLKPVPRVSWSSVTVLGQPVIMAEVERGTRICSTHDNRTYIRKGATNRMADPESELPLLFPKSSEEWWQTQL